MNEAYDEILSPEEIKFFQQNQHLITAELLASLRAKGNAGKRIALEILDTPKNERNYHLDAFGDAISFEGNKALKKPDTQMSLAPIHIEEIEKCAKDLNYFRENYIQIITPKGVNFPDLRDYQTRFIDALLLDKNETVVGLMGRQCISAETKLDLEDQEISIKELFEMQN